MLSALKFFLCLWVIYNWIPLWQGVLALCGMNDEQAKPVLLSACNDNSVRLYDLPS